MFVLEVYRSLLRSPAALKLKTEGNAITYKNSKRIRMIERFTKMRLSCAARVRASGLSLGLVL